MKYLLIFILIILSINTPHANENEHKNLVKYALFPFVSNNQKYLAVTLKNESGWHTYWKNPGDAGTPTNFKFTCKPKTANFKELEWMTPSRYFEQGDLMAIGYSNAHTYFFEVSNTDLKNNCELKIHWLVCKDICIPGNAKIDFSLTDLFSKKIGISPFGLVASETELKDNFSNLPKLTPWPKELDLELEGDIDEKKLNLKYKFNGAKALTKDQAQVLLTPFLTSPLGFKREIISNNEINLPIDWDGDYLEPAWPFPMDGKLKKNIKITFLFTNPINKIVSKIEKNFDSFKIKKKNNEVIALTLNQPPTNNLNDNVKMGLIGLIALSFIGGLILNLMPCVLPVISLKLYSLIKQSSQSDKKILRHNISYTLGILVSFWILSAIIIGLKTAGSNIGWGFQLQSPLFVSIMILFLFIFSLNLFGLFEFITPGGKSLGGKNLEDSFIGDFFGGIFATILSTPCSAPFLGTALSFAFTTTSLNIFISFTFIGLGLASPFLLSAFVPSLIHLLPRPGHWMEHLKKILGFSLILTTIWLYDVLLAQHIPSTLITYLNLTLGFIFFSFLLKKLFYKKPFIYIFAFVLTLFIGLSTLNGIYNSKITTQVKNNDSTWVSFSEENLKTYIGKNTVFIDFTADWCFTCKVNEKLVLNTNDFKNFAQTNNIILMKGDWTHTDESITLFLKKFNVFAVPAYFIQNKDGTIKFIGETITINKIKNNL